MHVDELWQIVETSRRRVADPADGDAVAAAVSAELATRSAAEIVLADRTLWTLMAESERHAVWAAAYLINGGCSDDSFDYFRGWLIAQGRDVFTHVVDDPDTLAELAVIQEAAVDRLDSMDCEAMLGVGWDAHRVVAGADLPNDGWTVTHRPREPEWEFDFEDQDEMRRRLPRLARLFLD
ncbi:MAG TPA: DUF4240 domain-containing protein [Yinghuangia sp.]|nr:DUF4240 domain-containing protein [Yinghuangia sp.]